MARTKKEKSKYPQLTSGISSQFDVDNRFVFSDELPYKLVQVKKDRQKEYDQRDYRKNHNRGIA